MDFTEPQDGECLQNSISSIESLGDLDWDGLLEVCKEKEEKLNLAGTYGLKLHEQLQTTQAHMEEMRLQHETEMEKMIQETFELKNKLECKEKCLQSQQQEFETYLKQITTKNETEQEELQNQFKKDLSSMKKERDTAVSVTEQTQLKVQLANKQINRLEQRNQELQTEIKKKVPVVDQSEHETELFKIHERVIILEEEIEQQNSQIQKLRDDKQTLALELSSKISETDNLTKELEEVEMRSTSYFNHLQKAREEMNEMKVELEALKADMRNSGHSEKGNSLFGEVEDKRVAMEKKLLSMQVKYESLQKAYTFVKSQLHNMKAQVVALLQINSGRADGERISHLERALSQAKAESLALTNKIKDAEAKQDLSTDEIQAFAKTLPNFRSNQDMITFLSIQIDDYKKQLQMARDELDQTYMIKLAESDKLQTAEQKLYETGILSEKYKNENMKLRLRLEEAKNKLQAETQKREMIEKKFNYDSSNDVVPLGVLSDSQVKEKAPLCYTLTKAKEKANQKYNQAHAKQSHPKTAVDFKAGMQWDLLPKEILYKFGIDKNNFSPTQQSENVSTLTPGHVIPKTKTSSNGKKSMKSQVRDKENTDMFSSNTPIANSATKLAMEDRVNSLTKNRKVSFKVEPETIPTVLRPTKMNVTVEMPPNANENNKKQSMSPKTIAAKSLKTSVSKSTVPTKAAKLSSEDSLDNPDCNVQ